MRNVNDLPPDLPRPIDDGKATHLTNMALPDIKLVSTQGILSLYQLKEPFVLFIYPRAGSPLESNNDSELWDKTPGARGCTPQSCGYRDLEQEFKSLGVKVYGLSMQSPAVQKEFVERNSISFPIISDSEYKLTDALQLPTFVFDGDQLIKRMALYIDNNKIEKVFYPVFPPDKNAAEVLQWLKTKR